MGADSALQLCSRLLFFSAVLVHGAVLESDVDNNRKVGLLPDEICPCIVRDECPRVFGSRAEDELLGSFSPCDDPDSVRCCGVTTRVSVEHSVSSNLPNSPVYGATNFADEKTPVESELRVIPPGIVVPVPFEFDEHVDPRISKTPLPIRQGVEAIEYYDDSVSYENANSEEAISDVRRNSEYQGHFDQRESTLAKTLRGENIDDGISQIDAFGYPDRLDYSGVNKYGVKGSNGVQAITGSRVAHHGEISSSKKVESTSSSSSSSSSSSKSEKNTESFVNSGDSRSSGVRLDAETFPQLQEQVGGFVEVDHPPARIEPVDNERFNQLKSGLRGSTVFENHQETLSQQKSEKVDKESSNFEESSSSSLAVENEHREAEDQELRRMRAYESQNRFSSQRESESTAKKSENIEKNSSSNFESVDLTTGDERDIEAEVLIPMRRRRPVITTENVTPHLETESTALGSRGRTVYGQRNEASSQQQSSSVKKESSNVEESTSSNIQSFTTNTRQQLDDNANSDLLTLSRTPIPEIRRPTVSRGNVVYGQPKQTSSQQQNTSVKKESSNVEESNSSIVQSISTNTEDLVNDDRSSDIHDARWRSVPGVRRPISSRGSVVYGQQKQTSSQQQSKSVKKESSNVEKNSSSNVESITTNTEDLSNHDLNTEVLATTWRPVPAARRPTSNRGSIVYGQQTQTSSQQQSESVEKESSNVEENTSSNVQSITTNTEDLSGYGGNSELLATNRRRVPGVRRPIVNRGNIVYGQQQLTSAQQQSKSVTKESSNVEKNSSSNVKSTATNTENLLGYNASSRLLATNQRPVQRVRRPIANRGSVVYGQQKQTTSQQHNESVKKESSNVKENNSSNVESLTTNTGNILDNNSEVAAVRRPTSNRGRVVYGEQQETSSQQQSNSSKQEASKVEENISSNVQSVITNTDLSNDDSSSKLLVTVPAVRLPTSNRGSAVYGQQQQTFSQQQSESMKKESSNVEESTSSNVKSIATNTGNILDDNSGVTVATRPTSNLGSIVYGQHQQTFSQQQIESMKKESANVEESTSSNVKSIATNTGHILDNNSEVVAVRRPTSNRGRLVYGQQQETSSQQQSDSSKQETSKIEENISSNDQSIMTNTDLSDEDASSKLLVPVPAIRQPTLNSGSVVLYGQHQQTFSQQQSESMNKESSNVEKSTSSNVKSVASNTGNILDDNSGVTVVSRPTSNRGSIVYGQRHETSSQEQSNSMKQESSKVEENISSNLQSIITNTANLPYDERTSGIAETTSNGNTRFAQRSESSNHGESSTVNKESSNSEKSTSSNLQTMISSNTEELSHDVSSQHVDTSSVNRAAYGQHGETTSTQEKGEAVTKESLSKVTEENTSSNIDHLTRTDVTKSNVESNANIREADQNLQPLILHRGTIPGSLVNNVFGQQTESSSKVKSEITSSESTSSKKESTTSTSNLWNLNDGIQSSKGKVISEPTETGKISNILANMNRKENTNLWNVANRTYVPVLINAGFLRDRPTATGTVGLDPLSGVTHTDIWDQNLAPELLPLTCGNVVFGERSRDGKTLICDIPQDSVLPIRFLGRDKMTVNPEKFNGPVLPGAIMPDRIQMHSETSKTLLPRPSSIVKGVIGSSTNNRRVENSMNTNSRVSESRSEDSLKTTTLDAIKNDRLRHFENGFVAKRPMQVPAEHAALPSRPAQNVYGGLIRYPERRRQRTTEIDRIDTVKEDEAAVGSRKVSKQSLSTSSSSSVNARSSQESISSSNSDQQITKSDFDVSSTDQYDAVRETGQTNSRLYLLPSAPVLPPPAEGLPEVTDSGEPTYVKIVEVVDEAPMTRTKISKKTSRNLSSAKKQPLKELQVVEVKASEDNGATFEETKFIVPEDGFRRPTFFYNRNSRQVKGFAPGVKEVVISPEELAMPGRISVVGPIPKGYKDPALFTEEELAINLPSNTDANASNSAETDYGKQIIERAPRSNLFKPSPVDPIIYRDD